MKDTEIFISNVKTLREHFNLAKGDVEALAKLSQNKYLRIENGEQEAELSNLTSIAGVYNLTAFQLLNPKLKLPKLRSLPEKTRDAVKRNANTKLRDQKKWNLNENIIIVLSEFNVGYRFTNSEIIAKFPEDLAIHMTNKSIEWNKGIVKDLAIDTKETVHSPTGNNTKPEKIYELAAEITPEILTKAQEKLSKTASNNKSENTS